MNTLSTNHIGQNIRKIRLLRGMKQDTFAKEMGIAQQNVSKMENKKEISEEQLEQASKILNASVETIKNFDEKVIINNNIFSHDQINHPITEVINYFKGEIDRKDEEIDRLRAELLGKDKKQESKTTTLKVKEG